MCDMSSRPSTWYEEERSRILYTCEEKYDGNMVAYVIDMESQLIGLKLEHEALLNDIKNIAVNCDICKYENTFSHLCDEADCDCVACRYTEECKCLGCTTTNNNFKWRGMQDNKGMQKPLMLEHLNDCDICYIEYRNMREGNLNPVQISSESHFNDMVTYHKPGWATHFNVDKVSYGRYWRLWSSRPTEEEREAAPWIQEGSERA